MAEIVFKALSEIIEPKTLIVLVGLYLIYKKIGVVECGVRSGLLAHITRIHAATTKNGYISKDTYQIVTECYTQYKSLGGDGYADRLMQEIEGLHFKVKKAEKEGKEDDKTT